jgi:hypothetical protein
MEQHFAATGRAPAGQVMMNSTAALQVILQAGPRREWPARVARAYRLGPTLAAIGASSPWLHGRGTGWKSVRQRAGAGSTRARAARCCAHGLHGVPGQPHARRIGAGRRRPGHDRQGLAHDGAGRGPSACPRRGEPVHPSWRPARSARTARWPSPPSSCHGDRGWTATPAAGWLARRAHLAPALARRGEPTRIDPVPALGGISAGRWSGSGAECAPSASACLRSSGRGNPGESVPGCGPVVQRAASCRDLR